jgi:hypothetical protein
MKQKAGEHPIGLGPLSLRTTAKEQRDYDACVAEVKAGGRGSTSASL